MLAANALLPTSTLLNAADAHTAPPDPSHTAEQVRSLPGPFEQTVPPSAFSNSTENAAGYDTVLNNGPSSNRVDIVILGDGYTASQIDTTYVGHVDDMLDYLFNAGQDPFPRYHNFFNAHRVNVISNESGADKAPENVLVDTALDAHYYCANIERLICISNSKANAAKNAALSNAGFSSEMDFVSVNDTKYGGSGGTYAVFAGGNSSANELALHEVAHSFDNLADEYGGSPNYTGPEPREVNVTTSPAGAKWDRWIGYQQPGIGTIGAYEGGRYFDQGIYRPSNNSKMRSLGRPFDAVSREKIILDIYALVDPIDDWSDNSAPVEGAAPELWVQPVDTDVLTVEWSVDGSLIAGANGVTFDPTDYGFAEGSYSVSARVFDDTDWVRHQTENLAQTVSWTVNVVAAPEVSSVTLNDGNASRSLLTSATVGFDSEVVVSADSFAIRNRSTNQLVSVQVTTSTGASGTLASLTFLPGPSVTARASGALHSLDNGTYELTVIGTEVAAASGGATMSADYVFGELEADSFYRQFGDSDGDRDVDGQDYGRFGLTFLKSAGGTGFEPVFDFEGDGDVDGQDYGQFGLQFLKTMPH